MTEAFPAEWHDETRHWQMLHALDTASEDMSRLDTEHVLRLFRTANIAIAGSLIGDTPSAVKHLSDYADRAEAFGAELQLRYHRQHRK